MGRGHGSQVGGRRPPVWWPALNPWSRISFLGLVAAAALVVGLGVYIPRQVEQRMLESQAEADHQVLQALLGTRTLALGAAGSTFTRLDRFVEDSVLRGDFVRVKLWSPEGTILFSDESTLVGRHFPPSEELKRALGGQAQHEISDLSEPENFRERGLAERLLELYLPVQQDGSVVAVWEIYRPLDSFDAQLARVRAAVWLSVSIGLSVLLVFLVSSFGGLVSAVARRRREAEERSRELGTLLEVSRSTASSLDPGPLAEAAVGAIRDAAGVAAVALVDRGREPAEILARSTDGSCPESCAGALTGAPGQDPAGCSTHVIPLEGEAAGLTLVVCRPTDRGFTDEERAMLKAAGEQIRTALENARLYEELRSSQRQQRRLMSRLVSAQEDERRRIVGEIHDGLGQDLHRVLFGLRGSRSGPPEEVAVEMARLEGLVEESTRRLRRLLQALRPPALEDVGLTASLRSLADRAREEGLQVEFRSDGQAEPPLGVRVATYRIVQEALRNVARHAGTSRAVVELGRDGGALVVRISDRGSGVKGSARNGLGLWLMTERAEAVGGTLTVESEDHGTIVALRVPVEDWS